MPAWWADEDLTLVNGVFKGGGARGVAYAGALRAVADCGYWFSAVAGASAGAITASLIAAGLSPRPGDSGTSAFEEASRVGLSKVRRRLGLAIFGFRDSVYDANKLYEWLAEQLTTAVGSDACVLFETLPLDLYVVAMDLHSGAPVVFSKRTTPRLDVAAAVVASCAIPGMLPSGRMLVRDTESAYPFYNQLVDGGAWANFPVFVFKDRLFRDWLLDGQPDADAERLTLGFVLDDPLDRQKPIIDEIAAPAPRVDELDRGSASTGGSTLPYAVAKFVGGNPGRFVLAACMISWLGMTVWAYPQASRAWTAWAVDVTGPAWPLVSLIVIAGVLLAALLVGTVAVGVAILGRASSKTAIPAAKAALGVATGTPPWIGARADRFAAICVPTNNLVNTLDFDLPQDVWSTVVRAAMWSVGKTLEDLGRNPSFDPSLRLVNLEKVRQAHDWPDSPVLAVDKPVSVRAGVDWSDFLSTVWLAAWSFAFIVGAIVVLETSSFRSVRPNGWQIAAALANASIAFLFALVVPKLGLRVGAGALVVLALAVAASNWSLFEGVPWVIVGCELGGSGVYVLFLLLGRGARRARLRANSSLEDRTLGWLSDPRRLWAFGTAALGVGLVLCVDLAIDYRSDSIDARVLAVERIHGAVQQTVCLLEGPPVDQPQCGRAIVTVASGRVSPRAGERVLVRELQGRYEQVQAPPFGALLGGGLTVSVGIGLLVVGFKQRKLRRRWEDVPRRGVTPRRADA